MLLTTETQRAQRTDFSVLSVSLWFALLLLILLLLLGAYVVLMPGRIFSPKHKKQGPEPKGR
jgi:hypothetical protein